MAGRVVERFAIIDHRIEWYFGRKGSTGTDADSGIYSMQEQLRTLAKAKLVIQRQ